MAQRLELNDRPTPGQILLIHGFPAEAIPFLEKEGNDPRTRHNLAIAHRWLGRLDEAEGVLAELVKSHPDIPQHWNSLGSIHDDFARWEQAQACYYQAMKVADEQEGKIHPQYHLNYAYSLMREERFAQAWPHWEMGRLNVSWKPVQVPWNGGLLEKGRKSRLLVITEGGYGDTFLMKRFFHTLAVRTTPTFQCLDRITEMAACGFTFPIPVIPESAPFMPPDYDNCTSLLSLMSHLEIERVRDIPVDYDWSRWLGGHGHIRKWGFCWKAEEHSTNRRIRSIPDEDLGPMERWKDQIVNLCPGPAPAWMPPFSLGNWGETAKALLTMDFVVSVDTAVAHLAGCLGVPAYILVPYRSDWKWFLNTNKSPWYPSVQLVRNRHPVSWTGTIEALANHILPGVL